MAVVEVTEVVAAAPAAEGPAVALTVSKKLAKEKKARATKAPKEKKPKGSRSSVPAHPPYFQMIKEAILALNEKTGSSPHAIAKFMEEKHKGVLPANFKKVLFVQLKNFTTKGKLLKVKASFKLSETGKKDEKEKEKKKKVAKKPEKKPEREAKKPRETRKRKVSSEPAAKKVPKASSKPKRAPTKKAKSLAVSPKPRQPKSIKSPVAKRARKAAA